jgi:hypothetical protein
MMFQGFAARKQAVCTNDNVMQKGAYKYDQ